MDQNGTVDSADTDSWLSVAGNKNIGTAYVRGDAELDGDVDTVDLNALGTRWQSTDSPQWQDGNFNADEIVDSLDLNEIGTKWQFGTDAGAAAVDAVPEPSGLALLPFGMIGLLGRRQRRN